MRCADIRLQREYLEDALAVLDRVSYDANAPKKNTPAFAIGYTKGALRDVIAFFARRSTEKENRRSDTVAGVNSDRRLAQLKE